MRIAHQRTHILLLTPEAAGSPSPRTYYPELDGVRAIAIAMVMYFHMVQAGVHIPGPVALGQTGVDLFFVLSGFLITGILLKSPQHDWQEVRRFYIRRTLRIFPLYYGLLLVLHATDTKISGAFWLYLQNLYIAAHIPVSGPNHFWSLAVEEQFYLLWPFVVLFLPRRWLKPSLWMMIFGALACRLPLIHFGISPFYFTLSRIDALAAGGLLSLLHSQGKLPRLRTTMWLSLAAAGLMLIIEGRLINFPSGVLIVQTTKFSLLALAYASGIGLVITNRANPLIRFLRSAPLRFVGRISYGLYVFHPIVFALVFPRLAGQPSVVRGAVGILATIACALMSWYGMERYLFGLKDKLAPERARFPASAPSMTAL